MERIYATYARLLEATDLTFTRYLYKEINWDNRFILIKGQKGVGKTTMLLQHIKRTFANTSQALYVSVDDFWFATHTLLELADFHYAHGGTHLFLDEIHKYPGWEQQVKNIYDSYPALHIVVTGSCMLKLENLQADMSRRARQYTLFGMSFREYLLLEGVAELPALTLDDILENHFMRASAIAATIRVLPHFERYVRMGYYPFYREAGDGFNERLQQVVNTILESEIPAVGDVEYESIRKTRLLLGVLAEHAPFTLNVSNLSSALSLSRNTMLKLFELMEKAALIRRLYAAKMGMGVLVKPDKILFDNTNLMYALSGTVDAGTLRETCFASMLASDHTMVMPQQGDFVVDGNILFEIGGKGKKFTQIKDVPRSYVVADQIEVGMGNKIPLWLFGFLY